MPLIGIDGGVDLGEGDVGIARADQLHVVDRAAGDLGGGRDAGNLLGDDGAETAGQRIVDAAGAAGGDRELLGLLRLGPHRARQRSTAATPKSVRSLICFNLPGCLTRLAFWLAASRPLSRNGAMGKQPSGSDSYATTCVASARRLKPRCRMRQDPSACSSQCHHLWRAAISRIGAERISKCLEPRQPDALRARLRRELHLHHRRQLPGAGGARRYLQGPQHLPHYDWTSIAELSLPQGLPAGRRGAAGRGHRPAELPPSAARRLRAGAGAGLAVAASCSRAATTWCASPPASASTWRWPAPSSCTTACARLGAFRSDLWARAGRRAGTRPTSRETATTPPSWNALICAGAHRTRRRHHAGSPLRRNSARSGSNRALPTIRARCGAKPRVAAHPWRWPNDPSDHAQRPYR